ncbi:right-handed parallel beta-helix repeat-containing protein [Dyella sp. 2HG41-7]|uniref:right-handed parallel beta-helix repeat-containing protein n=1 Tax=Dyella sp. 2HG41-7 TaxID=2883239 RepID=UPI001F22F526
MKNRSALKGAQGNLLQGFDAATSNNINLTKARRKKLLTGIVASLALSMAALPASATNWWNPTPVITVGSTVINVQSMGATGNGVTDDTAAFQAAINALPSTGGVISVPAGTYMINALVGIKLRSNMRLSMQSTATLKAIPNSADRSWVIKAWNVNNVEIAGGNIVGERVGHTGTTGQWGYCVNIEGSSTVYVHDINLSNSWGDGILVGGTGSGATVVPSTNVTLNNVNATNNRRQGLTIAPSTQLYVVNSSFTSSNGISPQAGIDIEPDIQGNVNHVRLENDTLSNNVGNGLEIHANVNDVTLTGSTAQNNKGYGAFTSGSTNLTITNNNLIQNYLFGVDIAGVSDSTILENNTITYNGDAWFYAHNVSIFTEGWVPRDITIATTATNVTQSGNTISPMK